MENVTNKIRLSRDRTYGDVILIIGNTFPRYELFRAIKSAPYLIIFGGINFNISRTKSSITSNLKLLSYEES